MKISSYIKMLLINMFKKASNTFSVLKHRLYLMLLSGFNMNTKLILIALICLFPIFGFSQNLDSLLTVAKKTENDSVKIRMYNKLAFSYIFNDTEKALKVINEGKQLAKAADFNFGLNELTNVHGIYMDVTGQSDSAKFYYKKALKMSQDYGFKKIESMCINNLGMLNWNLGNYEIALDYFFQSLKMDEATDSGEDSSAIALNNIGLIYQEMNLSKKALNYHKKALAIREKYNMENEQIASLNNIGINLKDLGRIDEAISTYKKGIALAKRKENLMEYYRLLDNLANAYSEKTELELALQTYLKALERAEGYNADEKSLLSTYNNIATLYNETNQPKLAKMYLNKGFSLVEKYPETELVAADLYLTSAESHYMLDDFETARAHRSKFTNLKDSIFSETNAEKIADLEIKYETEKKETEILLQRAKIAESDLIIQERNYQIFGLIGLAVILSLIGYLIYNQQELKNKQLQKENELKDALIKIETQNKLQEQRLRISRDLHDNIGAQLTFIISSIDNLKYAFEINDEKLNTKLSTISNFASSTIYELRDTIWAMNKSEITFEDLQIRISNFIDKADLASHNITFNFKVEDGINKTFTSIEGMNIYRIIQEAINNTLKYAEASDINIVISKVNKQMQIEITDDGKGFDETKVALGNGIQNMKKRAMEMNGNLIVRSDKNRGTTISLNL
ncbi:tetratricopeptide repeat-containing sensor histidine kinase [Winogradskyella forsetii]|uniref:tetratricopeptide repeat-containing sensor histidine kinase n=1 Tax=Winogradskyella forsetii TaxID=2686077 RepID=UPI0015B88F4F|nr:tetratricopeptide repeat protein [Winogradskyella forsetii]